MNESDLKTIFPTAKEITIAGETLALMPMRFAEFAGVLDHLEPIAGEIAGLVNGEAVNFISLLARGGKHLIPIAAILTGKPEAWVAELPLDEAARLLGALFELNRDFFSTRVLPALGDLVAAKNATTGAPETTKGKTKREAAKPAGAGS